jgi:hypothetical protein
MRSPNRNLTRRMSGRGYTAAVVRREPGVGTEMFGDHATSRRGT